jgi:divalent metal cation (Fe/Co/Zn/Cd) transporter
VFGGLVPLIGVALVAQTGIHYAGLLYPIGIALMTFVVGMFLTKDTSSVKMWDELDSK